MTHLADGGLGLLVVTLFNALTEGSTYALIAVGYTMVYGIVRLINFAHGEVYMIGAMTTWLLFSKAQLPLVAALPLAMGLCAALGVLIDRVAYVPLRRSTRLAALITAIGVSLILQTGVQLLVDPDYHSFPEVTRARVTAAAGAPARLLPEASAPVAATLGQGKEPAVDLAAPERDGWVPVAWDVGPSATLPADPSAAPGRVWLERGAVGLRQGLSPAFGLNLLGKDAKLKLPLKDVLIWVAAAVMMGGLHLLVQRTKVGRAMRACALDQTTAALMGVDVNRVIAVTFALGSAMAAVAGVLYAIKVGGNINFRMGYYPGVIAFAAAVLGGIGDLKGALLGGMLLGFCKAFCAAYLSSQYDFACCFSVMILIIIVRPYGLLGRAGATRA